MGHLTLISEDVIGALEHFPPDLRLLAAQYAPQPEWDEYVTGRYKETKKKDTSLLGGGKPVVAPGMRSGPGSQWRVDEADTGGVSATAAAATVPGDGGSSQGMKGEFKRTAKMRESSADFGRAGGMDDDDEEFTRAGPPHASPFIAAHRGAVADVSMVLSLHTTSHRKCSLPNTLNPRTRRLMTKRKTVAGWLIPRLSCARLQCLLASAKPTDVH